jgi:hypothetical protein
MRVESPPVLWSNLVVKSRGGLQINPNREEFGAKQTNGGGIPRTAWPLSGQPALMLARIVVREQMWSACVPASAETIAQFYPHTRVLLDVADVPGFPPVLRD